MLLPLKRRWRNEKGGYCRHPDQSLDMRHSTYRFCDLMGFDEELIGEMAADSEVEVLMITVGFGRVANFEYLHPAEIQNLLTVNTVEGIKIIRYFCEIDSVGHLNLLKHAKLRCDYYSEDCITEDER